MLSIMAVGILVFFLAAGLFPHVIRSITDKVCSPLPPRLGQPLMKLFGDLIESADVLRSGKALSMTIILSILIWLSGLAFYYAFLFFFDLEPSLGLALAVLVILALAVAAPSAPGFLGVYQTACIAAFVLFDQSPEMGAAYSIITHVFHFVIFIAYGLYVMAKYQMSFSQLQQRTAERSPANG